MVQGRSLTLDLALTDGRISDPFIKVTGEGIAGWARTVWEGSVPLRDLQIGLCGQERRLWRAEHPWKRVYGQQEIS
jgi:hypothetical protein